MVESGKEKDPLVSAVIEGLREKKGYDLTLLDMTALRNPVADYFLIASGSSDRQVQALANSVEEVVFKKTGEKPLHIEGYTRGEWILLDFVSVVAHIFQPRVRAFYCLEELWGDAQIENLPE